MNEILYDLIRKQQEVIATQQALITYLESIAIDPKAFDGSLE